MKKINEVARTVDVVLETDVLVVGSGPGGLAAALAASRAGAETALIDRNGCFGGNITQVGVEGFAWYRHEKTVDCEGIGIEFEQRAKAMGAAMPEPQSLSHALDAEMFKWVADTLVEEAGVKPLLHRLCVAPIMEGRAIRGVTNGDSPEWLRSRLKSAGQRPISALVDITNYVMLTYGRPTHAYDLAQLSGPVVARRARDGGRRCHRILRRANVEACRAHHRFALRRRDGVALRIDDRGEWQSLSPLPLFPVLSGEIR